MNRRDALDPRRLAILADAVNEPRPVEADPDEVLYRFARQAMATTFEVVLPAGTPNAHAAAEAALDDIDRLEQQMTVYRESSEVSLLNRVAAERPIAVEQGLFELFVRCRDWNRESRGAFDIATGAIIKRWAGCRKQGIVPTTDDRRVAIEHSGMRRVVLDPAERTVRFETSGVEINLGSVGKGYAVDQVIRLLRRDFGVASGLVHGGHSSIFAMGSESASTGWLVGLSHPEHTDRRLGVFRLQDRGLGISAATHQHFEHAGRKLGHILDPRTAWPAEGVLTAAVTAPTAAEADAMATAFFILGPMVAKEICTARSELGCVILSKSRLDVVGTARLEFKQSES
jgi:thiamine biosynthesis lipoprotein